MFTLNTDVPVQKNAYCKFKKHFAGADCEKNVNSIQLTFLFGVGLFFDGFAHRAQELVVL